MYELMMTGCKIEIKPCKPETKDFSPATFKMDEHAKVWSFSPALGWMRRDEITKELFDKHILQMLDEGFQISVKPA